MKNLIQLASIILLFQVPIYSQLNFIDTFGPEGLNGFRMFQNEDFLFISDSQSIYRSEDGNSWTKINQSLGIDFAIFQSKIISLNFIFPQNYAINYSLDNGDSWQQKIIPTEGRFADIAINSEAIFLIGNALEEEMWRSEDFGNTWTTEPLPSIGITDLYSFDNQIYAETSKDLYRYNNSTQEWEDASLPELNPSEYISDVYATAEVIQVSTNEKVYSTQDFGQTWKSNVLENLSASVVLFGSSNMSFVNTWSDIYLSDDLGDEWNRVAQFNHTQRIVHGAYFKSKFYLLDLIKGLFIYDLDTNSLTEHNMGLSSPRVYATSLQKDSILWTTSADGIYKYYVQEEKWEKDSFFVANDVFYEFIDSEDNGMVVVQSNNAVSKEYYLSENFGQTWALRTLPYSFTGINVENMFVSDTYLYLQTNNNRIGVSEDKGGSWRFIPEHNIAEQNQLTTFKNKNWVFGFQHIYSSEDHFKTYDTIEFDFRIEQLYSTENYMFILASNINFEYSMYYSTNGIDWIKSNWNFNDFFFENSLAFIPESYTFFEHQDTLYFNGGHVIDLHFSTDGGDTWRCHSDGFSGGINVTEYSENQIYVGNSGVHRSVYPTPIGVNLNHHAY